MDTGAECEPTARDSSSVLFPLLNFTPEIELWGGGGRSGARWIKLLLELRLVLRALDEGESTGGEPALEPRGRSRHRHPSCSLSA